MIIGKLFISQIYFYRAHVFSLKWTSFLLKHKSFLETVYVSVMMKIVNASLSLDFQVENLLSI